MIHIIPSGNAVRMLFDDAIDTAQELIFELGVDSSLELVVLLTGRISHLSITVRLIGAGAQTNIKGLYILKDTQRLHLKTEQLHYAPNTISSSNIKGILYDASFVQYHGSIYIDQQAKHANAKQLNKNILLSSHARAQSVPCLEVLNKHVQCSHGSAVGNLDQEIVFYMQTRGLSAEQAQRVLLQGFAQEIWDALPADKARHIQLIT